MINVNRLDPLPMDLESMLEILNKFYPDEISVIDVEGKVHGALSAERSYFPAHSGLVEIWTGTEFTGYSMETVGDALLFLQGFFTSLLCFPTQESVDKLLAVLQQRGGGTWHDRVELICAIQSGLDVRKVFDIQQAKDVSMIRSTDEEVFVTDDLNLMLFMINQASEENLSVVDVDGTVHGFLRTDHHKESLTNQSGMVQIWAGTAPGGIEISTMSEALGFIQGYFSCMFKNRHKRDIIRFINRVRTNGEPMLVEELQYKLWEFQQGREG